MSANSTTRAENRNATPATVRQVSNTTAELLLHLIDGFDRRVQAAPADRWTSPTPCTGWTAADLLTHVTKNAGGMAAALTDSAPPSDDADDLVGSWNASRDALVAALGHADLSKKVPGPVGLMPAEQIIERLMSVDVLVHTWDLARAVGGDEHLDPADVQRAHDVMLPMDSVIRAPGVFGDKVEPAADADAQTRFLNFLGRTV